VVELAFERRGSEYQGKLQPSVPREDRLYGRRTRTSPPAAAAGKARRILNDHPPHTKKQLPLGTGLREAAPFCSTIFWDQRTRKRFSFFRWNPRPSSDFADVGEGGVQRLRGVRFNFLMTGCRAPRTSAQILRRVPQPSCGRGAQMVGPGRVRMEANDIRWISAAARRDY